MAASVATATVNGSYSDSRYHAWGTLAIGASPLTYTSGGIACTFVPTSGFSTPTNKPLLASVVPDFVIVEGLAGYTYSYIPGATLGAGLLKILVQDGVSQNPLAELTTNSAIPAGVSGDTVTFIGQWPGMF